MKQTAVQFCADKIDLLTHSYFLGAIKGTEYYEKLTEIVKEAMELEKEQITDAFKNGENNIDSNGCHIDMYHSKNYYNKTFNL